MDAQRQEVRGSGPKWRCAIDRPSGCLGVLPAVEDATSFSFTRTAAA